MSDLVRKLNTPLVMSMFVSESDLHRAATRQRKAAAARILELEADNAILREALEKSDSNE